VYDDSSDWHTVSSSIGTEERVDDLEVDEREARRKRWLAQYTEEDVGWSSCMNKLWLHAPIGTTDESLEQHIRTYYNPDELAMMKNINLCDTQVTNTGVSALANACPRLEHMGLTDTQVTPSLAKVWYDEDDEFKLLLFKMAPDAFNYGGTIDDFRKQLRRVTNQKTGKDKKKKKRR
jgi:hypothetical protein